MSPYSWQAERQQQGVLCSDCCKCWAVGERRRREREGSEGGKGTLGEAAEAERKEKRRPSWGGEGWRGRVGSGKGR